MGREQRQTSEATACEENWPEDSANAEAAATDFEEEGEEADVKEDDTEALWEEEADGCEGEEPDDSWALEDRAKAADQLFMKTVVEKPEPLALEDWQEKVDKEWGGGDEWSHLGDDDVPAPSRFPTPDAKILDVWPKDPKQAGESENTDDWAPEDDNAEEWPRKKDQVKLQKFWVTYKAPQDTRLFYVA